MLPFGIRWSSLRTKIIAWSFVPTAIILATVALVTFYAYQQVTEELVIERDQQLVRLSAGQLAAELEEYADLLAGEARIVAGDSLQPDALRSEMDRIRNRLAVFDGGVVVLDNFGTVVATEPARPEILGQDWSGRDYFRQMVRAAGPVYSDIVPHGPDGEDVIVVAVPITGVQGREFAGVMAGAFRVGADAVNAFYGDIVKQHLGENGDTYLVDGAGRVIYHSVESYIGADFSQQSIVQEALDGWTGAVRTRDAGGRDIVAGFSPVPDTGWALVAEETWASLTSGSRRYRQSLLLLLLLGLVAPAIFVTIGLHRIMQPIEDLIGAAKEVAKGNFGHKIATPPGDEIGELAEQFNTMSEQLQESYANLERRVADRTRELTALYRADEKLYRHLHLDEVFQALVDSAVDILNADKSSLMVWDAQRQVFVVRAARGFRPETLAQMSFAPGEGIIGRAGARGHAIYVEDAQADLRVASRVTKAEGIRSFMHVPLKVGGEVFGVFNVDYLEPRAFGSEERRLFVSLAQRAALAIENARLYEAEQERLEEVERRRQVAESLRDVLAILNTDRPLDEVLDHIVEQANRLLASSACVLYRIDRQAESITLDASFGLPAELREIERLPLHPATALGRSELDEAILNRRPYVIPDVRDAEPAPTEAHSQRMTPELRAWGRVTGQHFRAFLAVPLVVEEDVYGSLGFHYAEPRQFSEEDVNLAVSFGNQAALAIENAQLRVQAGQAAVAAERSRLARDLHDAVTQTLFSASLIAEVLPRIWERDPEEGERRMAELRELTRGALAEMRTLLLELRPTALTEAELGELLEQLGEATTGRARVPVDVDVAGECCVPTDVKVAFYRIAQEALNNVAKHSGATQARVSLNTAPDRAEMCVADDGAGFDPSDVAPDSLGLGIMRERAEAIGADLEIDTEIGHGTRLSVVWRDGEGE